MSSPGQRLYERWCQSTGSDTAGYFRMMNPAERRRWEGLAEQIEAERQRLTSCEACGQAATWIASDRDERNEPVDCCAFCGARLPNTIGADHADVIDPDC